MWRWLWKWARGANDGAHYRESMIELSIMLEGKQPGSELVVSGCGGAMLPWSKSVPEPFCLSVIQIPSCSKNDYY